MTIDRIAEVLRRHETRPRLEGGKIRLDCACGLKFGPYHQFQCHREHVAAQVLDELGERPC